MSYHLDFETYSSANIKKFGGYRYAVDPSTEILIFAIREDDGPIETWDIVNGGEQAAEMFIHAVESGAIIYAHNAQFEAAICRYVLPKQLGIDAPKVEQWRCTAAMARRAAIPSSLAQCGEFLELGENFAKDKEGSRLIKKFSIPRKPTKKDPRTRILPQEDKADFDKFVAYCVQDVVAECAIHEKLAAFELKGAVLDSFQFDFRMNERGVPVNIAALETTAKKIELYEERLGGKFFDIVGLKHSQNKKVIGWMQDRGYPFTGLTKPEVQEVLANGPAGWSTRYVSNEDIDLAINQAHAYGEDKDVEEVVNGGRSMLKKRLQPVNMDPEAFKALEIRSMVSFAAVKKVPAMLGAACPDGRVRGALMWSGAERTHRWAGRIIQPQNFRRPTFKNTELAYSLMCENADIDDLETLFGKSYFEVVASSIRHFIQWPGGKLSQADYSSVEGRGAPWLCDGNRKLQQYRNNVKVYEAMAAKIFGCSAEQVSKEHKAGNSEKRFIGKQAELGCTYNMGAPKFRGTCEGFDYKPSPAMVADFKPKYLNLLAHAKMYCLNEKPLDKRRETGFEVVVKMNKAGVVIKSTLSVWAYRKDGYARKIANPEKPTAVEWLDLCYDDLARRAVTSWRQDNPEIVKAWRSLDVAAKDALRNKGQVVDGTSKIKFFFTKKPGFPALVLKLPSGHSLIYPKAKLVWKPDEKKTKAGEPQTPDFSDNYATEIQFWGKIPGKTVWGWCKTYGGKLLENATQAICGDLMGNGACIAEANGVNALMLVHDEMIAEQHEGQDHLQLCKHLCDLPKWANGFPLEAEGETIPFYKK